MLSLTWILSLVKKPMFNNQAPQGLKLDSEKPKIKKGFLEYFPRAIIEVAKLSEFGAEKYDWGDWQHVENGIERYSEAGVRHLLDSIIEGEIDSESNLRHATHEAWNAMAKLEFALREEEQRVKKNAVSLTCKNNV